MKDERNEKNGGQSTCGEHSVMNEYKIQNIYIYEYKIQRDKVRL